MISVVIPAHDEARTIGRLLRGLADAHAAGELDVIVVCNGCSDDTADVARSFGVRVLELAEPSKSNALLRGDESVDAFPRLYVDADVELGAADVDAVAGALRVPGVLAGAPRRVVPMEGVSVLVRWFYDVWQELPQVRTGLFGRGVIGVNEQGHQRIRALPPSTSDDLVYSEAFDDGERVVVEEAQVVVRPPRTVRDLLNRRVRSILGNLEASQAGLRGAESRTSVGSLLRLARDEPRLALRLPVFVGVGLVARVIARRRLTRGVSDVWLRDESSRS